MDTQKVNAYRRKVEVIVANPPYAQSSRRREQVLKEGLRTWKNNKSQEKIIDTLSQCSEKIAK